MTLYLRSADEFYEAIPSLASLPLVTKLRLAGRLSFVHKNLQRFADLEDITLDIVDRDLATQGSLSCFEAIGNSHCSSLRSLKVVCMQVPSLGIAIRPLFKLHLLSSFEVKFRARAPLHLHDCDLNAAIDAWLDLGVLILPINTSAPSTLTDRSVESLAALTGMYKFQILIGKTVIRMPASMFSIPVKRYPSNGRLGRPPPMMLLTSLVLDDIFSD